MSDKKFNGSLKGHKIQLLHEFGYKSIKEAKRDLDGKSDVETYEFLREEHNKNIDVIKEIAKEDKKKANKEYLGRKAYLFKDLDFEDDDDSVKEKKIERQERLRIENYTPQNTQTFMEFNHPHSLKKCNHEIKYYNERDEYHYLRNMITPRNKKINMYEVDIKSIEDIKNEIANLYRSQKNAFKLSVIFSFILEYIDNDGKDITYSYRIWRAQSNQFFRETVFIDNKAKLDKLLHGITKGGIYEYCEKQRPTSSHKLIGVISMTLKVFDMNYRIGANIELPEYIMKSQFINAMEESKNNMCFWNCYAIHLINNKRCFSKAKELYEEFYNKKFKTDYEGFDIYNELDLFENKFKIGVNIFELEDNNTLTRTRHAFNEDNYINLLLYNNHFSYIKHLEKIDKTKYKCENCGKCWDTLQHLKTHIPTCQDFVKADKFPTYPQIYEPKRNTIIELNEIFNTNCDFKYKYVIVFDFESICLKVNKQVSNNMKIKNKQVAVSVSIYSNVEGFEEEIFIEAKDPEELIKNMFEVFDKIAEKAICLMDEQFRDLYKEINKIKDEKKNKEYYNKLYNYINKIPIVGFNSGFYDINVNITQFMKELQKRSDNKIFAIKNGNSYKTLSGGNFQFLDICQYLPPGYNLDAYVKAFNPNGMKKGIFPYDFLDSYDKLNEPITILKRKDFYSSLKNKGITDKEWDDFKENITRYEWKTVRDLLKWYNNSDVKPFLESIINHRKFFYDINIDMFKDGFSLPALSEKIMFSYCFKDFNEKFIKRRLYPNKNVEVYNNIEEKLISYIIQDKKVEGRYNEKDFITFNEVSNIIYSQGSRCIHCWKKCTNDNWSLDRINNDIGHNTNNCVISCVECNKFRSDEFFNVFNRRKALIRYSYKNPLIYLIDEENKQVFYEFKNNICGGPSIVFHREHEVNKTFIKRPIYENGEWKEGKEGKMIKSIYGDDANALYLGCIGKNMPCGKLKYEEYEGGNINTFLEYFYGFVKVDIHTPEELKNYFGEFPPIFKNVEYDENAVMGDYMSKFYDDKKEKRITRKLISSYFGEGVLIKSDRLKWLIKKGLIVSKIHGYIECQEGHIFQKFADKVSEERRKGDLNPKYKIIGDMWKNVGNSAFGRTGMNKSKFSNTIYGNEAKYNKEVGSILFKDANEYGDLYEITKHKRTTDQDMPIQIACSIYDDAKFVMTRYYYDCVDKYISRDDFQYVQMDTDSAYIAYAGESFEELIKPEMREEYEKDKNNWFLRTDTKEHYNFDKRTPCLFKPEARLTAIRALSSKCYYGIDYKGIENKMSCKGIQILNNVERLSYYLYGEVLHNNFNHRVFNKGMIILNNKQLSNELVLGEFENNNSDEVNINRGIYRYEIEKTGLSQKYTKRRVLSDGVSTVPLNI